MPLPCLFCRADSIACDAAGKKPPRRTEDGGTRVLRPRSRQPHGRRRKPRPRLRRSNPCWLTARCFDPATLIAGPTRPHDVCKAVHLAWQHQLRGWPGVRCPSSKDQQRSALRSHFGSQRTACAWPHVRHFMLPSNPNPNTVQIGDGRRCGWTARGSARSVPGRRERRRRCGPCGRRMAG